MERFSAVIVLISCAVFSGVRAEYLWPFPTLIGDEFTVVWGVTINYAIEFPSFFAGRRRREATSVCNEFDQSTRIGIGLSRLTGLFEWLGLKDDECQKRMLCLVAQSQNKYSPLTDLIFQHFDPRLDYDIDERNVSCASHHRFYSFYATARKGFYPGTDCVSETALCPLNPDHVIDWNLMRTLQLLKYALNVKFLS